MTQLKVLIFLLCTLLALSQQVCAEKGEIKANSCGNICTKLKGSQTVEWGLKMEFAGGNLPRQFLDLMNGGVIEGPRDGKEWTGKRHTPAPGFKSFRICNNNPQYHLEYTISALFHSNTEKVQIK